MGKKSDRRIFRRRRQRVGFVLLVSLAVLVVGAVLFSSASLFGSTLSALGGGGAASVQRVDSPDVDRAPEAVAEKEVAAAEVAEKPAAEEKPAVEKEKARAGSAGNGGEGKAEQAQKEPEKAAQPEIPKPATNDLWMDIPALGLDDNYVANSNSPADLDAGATKTVESAFPWQDNANTYISAHRLGYPGTASDYQFYNLPNLGLGEKIYLYDANGTVYTYEVTAFQEVTPQDNWVTAPQAGRDMISLMTCIEDFGDYWTMGPNWYVRYIVQADRVSVDPA